MSFAAVSGLERRYLILARCRLSTRIERTVSPAWGINGGGAGKPGNAVVERVDGSTQTVLKDVVYAQCRRSRLHSYRWWRRLW